MPYLVTGVECGQNFLLIYDTLTLGRDYWLRFRLARRTKDMTVQLDKTALQWSLSSKIRPNLNLLQHRQGRGGGKAKLAGLRTSGSRQELQEFKSMGLIESQKHNQASERVRGSQRCSACKNEILSWQYVPCFLSPSGVKRRDICLLCFYLCCLSAGSALSAPDI